MTRSSSLQIHTMNIPPPLMTFLQHYGLMLFLSALLMMFYRVVMARKHSFRFQRLYLLAIPSICLLQIAVWMIVPRLSVMQKPEVLTLTQAEAEQYLMSHPEHSPFMTYSPVSASPLGVKRGQPASQFSVSIEDLLTVLYIAIPTVSVGLLLIVLLPLCMLRWQMRHLVFDVITPEYKILRASWVKTPCSLGRIIFLPCGRTAAEEILFIRHEHAHIVSGHSFDVWCIEVLVRLQWFNPVLWLVRKTLRDLHEFEADRLVLEQGTDAYTYQCLLVSEAAECCTLANGFSQSFIRCRIKEMKRIHRISLSRSIKVASVVWLFLWGCVLTIYAWPEKAAVIVNVTSDDLNIQRPCDARSETLIQSDRAFVRNRQCKVNLSQTGSARLLDTMKFESRSDVLANAECAEQISLSDDAEKGENSSFGTHSFVDRRSVYELPLHDETDSRRIWLEHRGDESHLTFVKTIRSDNEPVRFGGSDSYVVDVATGIHYKARRSIPAEAWHNFRVCGMKGKKIKVTVVFPRIPENVHWISLYQITGDAQSGDRLKVEDISQ